MKIQSKSIAFGIVCALFLIATINVVTGATITVDDSGGEDYTSIQAAVNAADPGDTILVYPGTYNENVDVAKQLNITSTGGASVTNVTAASASDHVFEVTGNGVTINGFNISGATGSNKAGIYVNSSGCRLTNNTAANNDEGIDLYSSNNNILTNNTAASNNGAGITVWFSSNNNTLINNTAIDNKYGIVLDNSEKNMLAGNTASYNMHGIRLYFSKKNTLAGNTASFNDLFGIWLSESRDNILKNNNAANTTYSYSQGISLMYSDNNTLKNNNATNNYRGIVLESSGNNMLIKNKAENNCYGIYLPLSYNNTLTNNTVEYSICYGIHLWNSLNNQIYNNLFNNCDNAKVENIILNNVWNITKTAGTNIAGGPYLGGNYWASPDGTGFSQTSNDADGDGICDSSYVLSENNIDYLPLASVTTDWNPWNDPDSDGGEAITLVELQDAIYCWRFGVQISTGELVDLVRLQDLIYDWRFG